MMCFRVLTFLAVIKYNKCHDLTIDVLAIIKKIFFCISFDNSLEIEGISNDFHFFIVSGVREKMWFYF